MYYFSAFMVSSFFSSQMHKITYMLDISPAMYDGWPVKEIRVARDKTVITDFVWSPLLGTYSDSLKT